MATNIEDPTAIFNQAVRRPQWGITPTTWLESGLSTPPTDGSLLWLKGSLTASNSGDAVRLIYGGADRIFTVSSNARIRLYLGDSSEKNTCKPLVTGGQCPNSLYRVYGRATFIDDGTITRSDVLAYGPIDGLVWAVLPDLGTEPRACVKGHQKDNPSIVEYSIIFGYPQTVIKDLVLDRVVAELGSNQCGNKYPPSCPIYPRRRTFVALAGVPELDSALASRSIPRAQGKIALKKGDIVYVQHFADSATDNTYYTTKFI